MLNNRTVIVIGYISINNQTSEVVQTEKTARAEVLNVYQSRLNDALIQGVKVNGRYKVRDIYDSDDINYVGVDGKRYRVNSVYRNRMNHFIELEIGEVYRG